MTLDHEDIAAIADAVCKKMFGLSEPSTEMGGISSVIPPHLYGNELLAFMDAREKEIRAKKRGGKK